MRYTSDDILRMYADIGLKSLEATEAFWDLSIEQITKICNGVGGAGSWLAGILTFIYRHYQLSAAIHDVCYHVAVLPRIECDKMLRRNMIREWVHRYGRWRWVVAGKERAKIELAYLAVRRNGDRYYGV